MSFLERIRKGKKEANVNSWRAESAVNPAEEYGRVQEELKKLETELEKNIEDSLSAKEQTPEDRELALQTNRKLSQRIEEAKQRKTDLEGAIRKAGGNPSNHTIQ